MAKSNDIARLGKSRGAWQQSGRGPGKMEQSFGCRLPVPLLPSTLPFWLLRVSASLPGPSATQNEPRIVTSEEVIIWDSWSRSPCSVTSPPALTSLAFSYWAKNGWNWPPLTIMLATWNTGSTGGEPGFQANTTASMILSALLAQTPPSKWRPGLPSPAVHGLRTGMKGRMPRGTAGLLAVPAQSGLGTRRMLSLHH